jgi:GTP cyclohydrolase II
LMTNNPKKIAQLEQYGVKVNERIPHLLPSNNHNRFYLETKAAKSGHLIDFKVKPHLEEQSDKPLVEDMAASD